MSEMRKPAEGIGPTLLLRDVLVDTHFKPGRALSPDVNQIDLGVFTDEARSLTNASYPNDGNFVKPIYVTGSEKVLIPKTSFTKSNSENVTIITSTSPLSKQEAKRRGLESRYLAMLMSTSSNMDSHTTLTGQGLLLLEDSAAQSPTASFSIGRTIHMITFRGENTPQLTDEEVRKKMNLWTWQMKNRFTEFSHPNMTQDEVIALNVRILNTMFKQIVKTYDLQYFEGESDQSMVTRKQP